jgi:hypothetical protein
VADIECDQLDLIEIEGPASNSLDDLIEPPGLRGDDGDPDPDPLPRVVMIDFGRRKLHAASQMVEQWTKTSALFLERGATGKPEFEFDGGGMHRMAAQESAG